LLVLLAFLAGIGGWASGAAHAVTASGTAASSSPSKTAAPARKLQARTRIEVYRAPAALPPTAVRHCVAWYAEERRPSGAVITPRMRCWWARR